MCGYKNQNILGFFLLCASSRHLHRSLSHAVIAFQKLKSHDQMDGQDGQASYSKFQMLKTVFFFFVFKGPNS